MTHITFYLRAYESVQRLLTNCASFWGAKIVINLLRISEDYLLQSPSYGRNQFVRMLTVPCVMREKTRARGKLREGQQLWQQRWAGWCLIPISHCRHAHSSSEGHWWSVSLATHRGVCLWLPSFWGKGEEGKRLPFYVVGLAFVCFWFFTSLTINTKLCKSSLGKQLSSWRIAPTASIFFFLSWQPKTKGLRGSQPLGIYGFILNLASQSCPRMHLSRDTKWQQLSITSVWELPIPSC